MGVCGTSVKNARRTTEVGGDEGASNTKKRHTEEEEEDEDDGDGRSIVVFASSMDGRVSVDVIVIDGIDIVDVGVGVDV